MIKLYLDVILKLNTRNQKNKIKYNWTLKFKLMIIKNQ